MTHFPFVFELKDLVRVSGRSNKGKNRIREHGDLWTVSKVWGSKVLLESFQENPKVRGSRWVDGKDDCDFCIELVIGVS